MSAFFRRRVEATIEHMIGLLDEMDGDPDLEPELVEEQHDLEATGFTYVLAERVRRRRVSH
ncbi:hypothetical protein NKH85_16985 [Mesorhizobium sp. M0924]|uniref:hypothetical protein n=1 Tax=unclassified Mesorhizobium TaxID=325217 RepID=UPI003339A079